VVPTSFYLILGGMLFTVGAIGVLTRRSALIILMCVELMLASVNLTLIAFSRQWDNLGGQVFVLMLLAVAAAEVAVGLAIIITHARHNDTTNVDEVNLLKW
jgi:NADH-quinone oxidoreductase subunit K